MFNATSNKNLFVLFEEETEYPEEAADLPRVTDQPDHMYTSQCTLG